MNKHIICKNKKQISLVGLKILDLLESVDIWRLRDCNNASDEDMKYASFGIKSDKYKLTINCWHAWNTHWVWDEIKYTYRYGQLYNNTINGLHIIVDIDEKYYISRKIYELYRKLEDRKEFKKNQLINKDRDELIQKIMEINVYE